eukprot:3445216-Amphidinium_carterae.1
MDEMTVLDALQEYVLGYWRRKGDFDGAGTVFFQVLEALQLQNMEPAVIMGTNSQGRKRRNCTSIMCDLSDAQVQRLLSLPVNEGTLREYTARVDPLQACSSLALQLPLAQLQQREMKLQLNRSTSSNFVNRK